ncbi:MAG: PAS domain S-box protein [Phenylobacterium sp.]|uniref:PAS domain S-box protein n=1 Tax=Phenylobacterium sp. TaxID=1871053 RepID=UPI0011FF0855|nr:PAS domain S-box protein [Phenylobacterium sp.]TAL34693.1 MAG: PAS domain S-box protein [Phenylobacterium sp.]
MTSQAGPGADTHEAGGLEQQRLAAIVEYCEDAIISLSLDGRVASWNKGAVALFGYTASEMVGQPITRIIPPERYAEEDRILSSIREGETVKPFETQRVRKGGDILDVSLTVSPVKDDAGRVVAASKVARDISARKRTEEAGRKLVECSQLVGRAFFDGMVGILAQFLGVRWVMLCDLDPANLRRARTVAAWTDGALQDNFEYELAGTPCANVLKDEVCYYPTNIAELFPEDTLLKEMGAESYLGVPLRASNGRTLGLLAVLHDQPLDERLRPRQTLELFVGRAAAELERMATASINERLGRIIEDAASETFVFDAETLRFVLVNRAARENLGYSMGELERLTPVDIKPTLTPESFAQLVAPLRTGEKAVINFQTIHRRKDGTDYDVDVRLQLLRDDERPVFYAAIEDITAREAAARALGDVSRRLDTILDNTTMAVFLMDDRQECIYMNEAAERLTGYRFSEVTGRPLHDVVHHTHPDGRHFPLSECPIDRAFPEDNQVQGEAMFVRKDGSFYPVAYTASPIRNEHGKPVGTVVEARNIQAEIEAREAMENFNAALQSRVDAAVAERDAVEAQLRHAQKMDAIGKLTGGIAHDFNNLLQVIGGNLQLLRRDIDGNRRAEKRAENAMIGVEKGARLAAQLLAFSRKQALAPRVVNLGRLVRGLDEMLRRTLGEGIEVETVISGGLWNTFIDETQVENAILNLAINARDAMDGYGKLTVEAGNAALDDRYVRRHPDVKAGQYVMLAVTDTGCGIPSDLMDRVLEPFFTTKPVGKGTGLGLSSVYGLVKQSGGHMNIYSEVGHGTTIRIYLPRILQEEAPQAFEDLGPVRGGAETVLVVEDDDDVRATAVELLTELGYQVVQAKDAASGLAIVESGLPIDLLFTDVVMPGQMQSRELAQRAQARLPGLAVLFTSGYTENAIVHGGRLDEGVELLSKPYTREALARRVRQCLDGSGALS